MNQSVVRSRKSVANFFVYGLWTTVYGLLLTGCVTRTLTIRSEPPGATILLNDKRVGVTPYRQEFQWYGWYRVALVKNGYERLDDRTLIQAPWYQWIPLDLAAELLPFQLHDSRELEYELAASAPVPAPAGPPMELGIGGQE